MEKRKRSCRKCSRTVSVGEIEIEKILKKYNVNFVKEFSLPNRQRFDFYIENLKIAIEYNGIQHYKVVDFFGGEEGFIQNQQRDEQKRQYCKDNDIKLIEIPYWDFNSIEKILTRELNL